MQSIQCQEILQSNCILILDRLLLINNEVQLNSDSIRLAILDMYREEPNDDGEIWHKKLNMKK